MDTTLNLLLIRHGETHANVDNLVCGQLDTPLTQTGHSQAELLKSLLDNKRKDVQYLFSSPLTRATLTCELVMPGITYQVVDALQETNTGDASCMTIDQLHAQEPRYIFQGFHNELKYPNGESISDVYLRMKYWIEETLLPLDVPTNKYVVIVGHAGTVNCFLHYFLNIPLKHYPSFHIDNCSITEIKYYRNVSVATVKTINQKS